MKHSRKRKRANRRSVQRVVMPLVELKRRMDEAQDYLHAVAKILSRAESLTRQAREAFVLVERQYRDAQECPNARTEPQAKL